jgi:hypothetical protein
MKIEEVVSRRTDLSTFLVHLTRARDQKTARDQLTSILTDQELRPGEPMGHAVNDLRKASDSAGLESQKCVSFTETPLEHIRLMVEQIDGRSCQFEPYGVVLTKKQGRRLGCNPVWYVDITPRHEWLSNSINGLVAEALAEGNFADSKVAKLTPFIEQMGTSQSSGYRKEFWWEREWRANRSVTLSGRRMIVICPEHDIAHFKRLDKEQESGPKLLFIDPSWSLERMIAELAMYPKDDIGPF